MEVLYILIPIAIILALVIAAFFIWAINNRQFDDLERHGYDIIFDDDDIESSSPKAKNKN